MSFQTFAQLQKNTPEKALDELTNHYTETNMTTYVYSLLKNNFKCKDINNNIWFFKDKHNEWCFDKDNLQFRIALHDIVCYDLLQNIHTNTAYMQTMEACDNRYKQIKNKTSRAADIMVSIDKEKCKNDIIKFCRDMFYKED